jgi:hypothetical protein
MIDVNTRESQKISDKWKQNVKHIIFQSGRSIYFPTYPPPTLIDLSNPFINASKTASIKVFSLLLQSPPQSRINIFVISEIFATFLKIVLNCF